MPHPGSITASRGQPLEEGAGTLVLRNLTPPREYALVWRSTLAAAGLYAQLGATVPTRAFHLAYSPGLRDGVLGVQRLLPRSGQVGRWAGTGA